MELSLPFFRYEALFIDFPLLQNRLVEIRFHPKEKHHFKKKWCKIPLEKNTSHKDQRWWLNQEGASSVHAVRGLICTRGQGTRLYTRNGFAVCTTLFLQLCNLCAPCVPPTHPTQRYVCVCVRTVGNVCKSKVCYHPHPTHPPTLPKGMCVCVCVQLGMYASPRYVTIPSPPTHPPNPKVCVCVCVQLGMYASPRYVTIPTPPTHPPTTHPTQRYVCTDESPKTRCVYRWVRFVRRWGFWSVCTDESNLCAQMSPLPLNQPIWKNMIVKMGSSSPSSRGENNPNMWVATT